MGHVHSGVWRFTVERGTVDEGKLCLRKKNKGFGVSEAKLHLAMMALYSV